MKDGPRAGLRVVEANDEFGLFGEDMLVSFNACTQKIPRLTRTLEMHRREISYQNRKRELFRVRMNLTHER